MESATRTEEDRASEGTSQEALQVELPATKSPGDSVLDEALTATISEERCPPELRQVKTFEQLQRVAKMYAQLDVMPVPFRASVGHCVILCSMAMQLGVPVLILAQNVYMVHGKIGMQAQLLIALANGRNVFGGPIRYEMHGERGPLDDLSCTAYAINRETGEKVEYWVPYSLAKAEGWVAKKDSKWKTNPWVMIRYRAAAFLIRTHGPEALACAYTHDELMDMRAADAGRPASSRVEEIAAGLPKPPPADKRGERIKDPHKQMAPNAKEMHEHLAPDLSHEGPPEEGAKVDETTKPEKPAEGEPRLFKHEATPPDW